MRLNLSKKATISCILISIFAVLTLFIYRSFRYLDSSIYVSTQSIIDYIGSAIRIELNHPYAVIASIGFFVLACIITLFVASNRQMFAKFIFRFRYCIALVALAICVMFDISGSSIGMWADNLPLGCNDGLLFGIPRECRTDEWALFTGMTFAQYYDPQGSWPLFGDVLRGVPTDMYMVYGQPVMNPAVLFRPFQLGYLVLGLEKGLSFYWCGRLIALIMASFELGRVITKDKRGLAVCFSALVSFSPVVSWWFSINCFVEMLIYLAIVVVAFYQYSNIDSKWRRIGLVIVSAYALVCFALTLYPAWEIPLLYLMVALCVGMLFADKSRMIQRLAADKIGIAIVCACAIVGLVCVVAQSADVISAEMNTDYPGKRINAGGGQGLLLFRYPISLFLAFVPSNALSGLASGLPDNVTTFFDLFPLGIVLFFINTCKSKQFDPVSIALVSIIVILGVYCSFGFPDVVAKVTLFGKSIPERAAVIFSFANLILLFREISRSLELKRMSNMQVLSFSFVLSVLIVLACICNDSSFFGFIKIAIIFVFVLLFALCIFGRHMQQFGLLCITVAVLSGVVVNPVQIGIAVVDSNPLIKEMRSIVAFDPEAKWITAVGWKSNIALFAGAPTLNTTNTYPNMEMWHVLDPDDEQKTDWNRYAHIHVTITENTDEPIIKLSQVDVVDLTLTIDNLRQLGVTYLLTDTDLLDQNENLDDVSLISSIEDYRIYKIE